MTLTKIVLLLAVLALFVPSHMAHGDGVSVPDDNVFRLSVPATHWHGAESAKKYHNVLFGGPGDEETVDSLIQTLKKNKKKDDEIDAVPLAHVRDRKKEYKVMRVEMVKNNDPSWLDFQYKYYTVCSFPNGIQFYSYNMNMDEDLSKPTKKGKPRYGMTFTYYKEYGSPMLCHALKSPLWGATNTAGLFKTIDNIAESLPDSVFKIKLAEHKKTVAKEGKKGLKGALEDQGLGQKMLDDFISIDYGDFVVHFDDLEDHARGQVKKTYWTGKSDVSLVMHDHHVPAPFEEKTKPAMPKKTVAKKAGKDNSDLLVAEPDDAEEDHDTSNDSDDSDEFNGGFEDDRDNFGDDDTSADDNGQAGDAFAETGASTGSGSGGAKKKTGDKEKLKAKDESAKTFSSAPPKPSKLEWKEFTLDSLEVFHAHKSWFRKPSIFLQCGFLRGNEIVKRLSLPSLKKGEYGLEMKDGKKHGKPMEKKYGKEFIRFYETYGDLMHCALHKKESGRRLHGKSHSGFKSPLMKEGKVDHTKALTDHKDKQKISASAGEGNNKGKNTHAQEKTISYTDEILGFVNVNYNDFKKTGDKMTYTLGDAVFTLTLSKASFGKRAKSKKEVEELPRNRLYVTVQNAVHLENSDAFGGKPDAYAVVTVGKQMFRTEPRHNKNDPNWAAPFMFALESPSDYDNFPLHVDIKDSDSFFDDLIGTCDMSIADLENKKARHQECVLHNPNWDEDDLEDIEKAKKEGKYKEPKLFVTVMKVQIDPKKGDADVPIPRMKPRPITKTEYRDIQLDRVWIFNPHEGFLRGTPEIFLSCAFPKAPAMRINLFPVLKEDTGTKVIDKAGRQLYTTMMEETMDVLYDTDSTGAVRGVRRPKSYYKRATIPTGDDDELLADQDHAGARARWGNGEDEKVGLRAQEHGLNFKERTGFTPTIRYYRSYGNMMACSVFESDGQNPTIQMAEPAWWSISFKFTVNNEDADMGHFQVHWNDFEKKDVQQYWTGDTIFNLKALPIVSPTPAQPIPMREIWLKSVTIHNPHEIAGKSEMYIECAFPDVTNSPPPVRISIFPMEREQMGWYSDPVVFNRPFMKYYREYDKRMLCSLFETDSAPPITGLQFKVGPIANFQLEIGPRDQPLGQTIVNFDDFENNKEIHYWVGEAEFVLELKSKHNNGAAPKEKAEEMKEIVIDWVKIFNPHWSATKKMKEKKAYCYNPIGRSSAGAMMHSKTDKAGDDTEDILYSQEEMDHIDEMLKKDFAAAQQDEEDADAEIKAHPNSAFADEDEDASPMDTESFAAVRKGKNNFHFKRQKKLREKKKAEEKKQQEEAEKKARAADPRQAVGFKDTSQNTVTSIKKKALNRDGRDDYHLDRKCSVPELYLQCSFPRAPPVRANLLIDPRRVGMRTRLNAPEQDIKQTFVRYYKSYGNVMVCSILRSRGNFHHTVFKVNIAELGKAHVTLKGSTVSFGVEGAVMPASLGMVVGKDDDHLGTFSVHYEDLGGIDKNKVKQYYTGDSQLSLSLASYQNPSEPPKIPFKELYLKSVRLYEEQSSIYNKVYVSCTTAKGPPLRVSLFPIQPETTGRKSTATYFHAKPLFRYFKTYGATGCGVFRASTKPPLKSIKFGVSLGTFAMNVNHDTRMMGMFIMNYNDLVTAGKSFRYWSGAVEIEVELRKDGDKSGKEDADSAEWKDIALEHYRIFNPHEGSSKPEVAMTCTFSTGPAPIRLDFPNLRKDDKRGDKVFPGDKCDESDARDSDCAKSKNYDPEHWQRKGMIRWYQQYGDTMTCNVVETDYKPPFESLKLAATSFARLSLAIGQQDQILGNFVVNFHDLGRKVGTQQHSYYTGESEFTLGLMNQSPAMDAFEQKAISAGKVPEYKEIQIMWAQVNNDRTPSWKATPEIYITCDPPEAPSLRVNLYPTPADSVGPAETREIERLDEKTGKKITERVFSTPGRLTFENEFQPDQKIRQLFRYYKYYGRALTCGVAQKVTNLPLKKFEAGVQLTDKHSLDFTYATDKNGNANVAVGLKGIVCEGCIKDKDGKPKNLNLAPTVGFQIGADDGLLGTFTINYDDFSSTVAERIVSTGDIDLRLRMDHHTNIGNKLSAPKKSAPPSELPDPEVHEKAKAEARAKAGLDKQSNLAVESELNNDDVEDEHELARLHSIESADNTEDGMTNIASDENVDSGNEADSNDDSNTPPSAKDHSEGLIDKIEHAVDSAKDLLGETDELLQSEATADVTVTQLSEDGKTGKIYGAPRPLWHDISLHSLEINDAHEKGTAELYLTCTFPRSSQIRYNIDISRKDIDKKILYDKPLLRYYHYYGEYMNCMVFEADGEPPINHFHTAIHKTKDGKQDIKASLSIGARDTVMGSFLVNFRDFHGDCLRTFWFGDGKVVLRSWSPKLLPESPFLEYRTTARPLDAKNKEAIRIGNHKADMNSGPFLELGLGKVTVFDAQTGVFDGRPDIYIDCAFPSAPNVRFNLPNLDKKFWKEGTEPKDYKKEPFVRYYKSYGNTMVCGVWEWDERSIIEKGELQVMDKFKVTTTLAADGTRKISASGKFNEDLSLSGAVSWNSGDTFLGRFVVNFDDFAGTARVRNYYTGSVTLTIHKKQWIQKTWKPRKDIFIKKVTIHNFREAGLPYVSEAEVELRCTHTGLNNTSADVVFPSPRKGFKTIAKELPWMSMYESYGYVHCQLLELDENTMPNWHLTALGYKLEQKDGTIDFQVPQLHDQDLFTHIKLKGKKANFGIPFKFVNQKLGSFFLHYNDFTQDRKTMKVWTGDAEIEFEWRQEGGQMPKAPAKKPASKLIKFKGVRVYKNHDKGLQGLNGVELSIACQFANQMKNPILFHIPVAKKFIAKEKKGKKKGDDKKGGAKTKPTAPLREVNEPFARYHESLGKSFVCTVVEKDFMMNVDEIKVALPMGVKQNLKIMKYKDVTMSTLTVNYEDFKKPGATLKVPSPEVELEFEWVDEGEPSKDSAPTDK